ncbi:hypothetical protein [Thermaerobacter litoralis]
MAVEFKGPIPDPANRPRGEHGAAVPVGLTGITANSSMLIRLAPWLLLIAVAFALIFVPFMVLPEIQRWSALRDEYALAMREVADAETAAASLAKLARELPQLEAQVAEAEATLIPVDQLPGVVTRIARQAGATGTQLVSVVFEPYQAITPNVEPGDQEEAASQAGGPAQQGTSAGRAEQVASGHDRSQVPRSPEASQYGRVVMEVTATGTWSQLADLLGSLGRDPGLRVQAWAASEQPDGELYQMRIRGSLYIKGAPPIVQGAPVSVRDLEGAGNTASGVGDANPEAQGPEAQPSQ